MIRTRLPYYLDTWLSRRGYNFLYPQNGKYLTDNAVYSAALEAWEDMQYEDPAPLSSDVQTMKRFIERESKKHHVIPLSEWYAFGL